MDSFACGPVVELNIGGTLFTTTIGTLLNKRSSQPLGAGEEGPNLFARLFAKESARAASSDDDVKEESAADAPARAGASPWLHDSSGRVFIDREGSLFAPILQYLRTGILCIPNDVLIDSLLGEAKYYGITLPLSEVVRVRDMRAAAEGTVPPLVINNKSLMRETKCTESAFLVASSIGTAVVERILTAFKEASDKGEKVQTGWIMERQPPNFAEVKFEHIASKIMETATKKKAMNESQLHSESISLLVSDITEVYKTVEASSIQRSSFFKYLDDPERRNELIAFCTARDLSIVVKKFVIVVFFNLGEGRFQAAAWSDEYYAANKKKVHAKVTSGYVIYWGLGKFQ